MVCIGTTQAIQGYASAAKHPGYPGCVDRGSGYPGYPGCPGYPGYVVSVAPASTLPLHYTAYTDWIVDNILSAYTVYVVDNILSAYTAQHSLCS